MIVCDCCHMLGRRMVNKEETFWKSYENYDFCPECEEKVSTLVSKYVIKHVKYNKIGGRT